MFVNQLTKKEDSLFSKYFGEAIISSCEVRNDKIIVSGRFEISGDEREVSEIFQAYKIVVRAVALKDKQNLLQQDLIKPKNFLYKNYDENFERTADSTQTVLVSQRIINNRNFQFEITNSADFLTSDLSISFSFIASGTPQQKNNYYSNDAYVTYETSLIFEGILSDKTYFYAILQDETILNNIDYPLEEKTFYASEIYCPINSTNNISISFFHNLEEALATKLYFKNLYNLPEFIDYFRKNMLVRVDAKLLNGNNVLSLGATNETSVELGNSKKNNLLILYAQSADKKAYDGGKISLEITYDESSVSFIQNTIIPFINNLSSINSEGTFSSDAINAILYYKTIKERSSDPETFEKIVNFKNKNTDLLMNEAMIKRLKELLGYTKNNFIEKIYKVTAENIANTKIMVDIDQAVYLTNKNASISFLEESFNANAFYPTYSTSDLINYFFLERTRFFSDSTLSSDIIVRDDLTLPLSQQIISFSPSYIFLDAVNVLSNRINFNNVIEINEEYLNNSSYEFAKCISYFSLNREETKARSYDYRNLMDKNLFYSGITLVDEQIPRPQPSFEQVNIKIDNPASYIAFPTNMTNDACIDSDNSTNVRADNVATQLVAKNIPENLFNNLTTNTFFRNQNSYAKTYLTLTPTSETPIQVLYPYIQFSKKTYPTTQTTTVTSSILFEREEPVIANSKLFSTFFLNFKVIGCVEYVSDLTEGMRPIWSKLNLNTLGILPQRSKMLCRMNFYKTGADEQEVDVFSIYNRYFLLEA